MPSFAEKARESAVKRPASPARSQGAEPTVESAAAPQRTCPCGGGCPRCAAKRTTAEEQTLEAEANAVGAEAARDFMPAPMPPPPAGGPTGSRAGGQVPLPLRGIVERQLGQDFSSVRMHTGKDAASQADALDAAAFAKGEHIYFAAGAYDPRSQAGAGLIAHELAHVAQQRHAPQPFVQRQPKGAQQTKITPPQDDNPLHDWVHPANAVLLVQSGDRLYIAPAERVVLVPPGGPLHAIEAPGHVAADLGDFFGVPASGASGTRVFKAGNATALMLDAGSDPSMGARVKPNLPTPATGQAAIYTSQLSALMNGLGISSVSQIRVIHGHLDHVGAVPAVVEAWGTLAQNVVIPQEYENLASVRQAIRTLRSTTDTNLTARGFGSTWNPAFRLKDKGAPGSDVYRHSFLTGDLVVEMVGLRSALRGVIANPALADTASLLTKVSRRTDLARVVVLGDFRGQDLERIKAAMEAEAAGSWNSFFAGAPTISGFSHHVGRLEETDVPGIMAVLDATLLQNGKLNVVEQTNPTASGSGQARVETLELLSHLGANVTYTSMPVAGAAPSSVTATKSTVTPSGPQATVNPVTQSNLTTGLERLRKLVEMKDTIENWRPWLEEINSPPAVKALLDQIQSSTETLRNSLRTAVNSATRVRAVDRPAGATGPRDYSSTGGTEAEAYQAALQAIPEKTPVENEISPESTRALEELRQMPVEEIPVRIAVHQAIAKGIYSDAAFTYLLGRLSPATRDSLIYGKRGGPVPRNVAFQRVRMQVEFERRVIPGETWSVSHWESGGARTAAVGVNILLLALELWNDIGQPLLEAHRNSEKIKEATQVVPFLRRIMFWQTMTAQCLYTGVEDPTFGSPSYIHDPDAINKKINGLDALFMQSPGLSDADVLRVAAWLSYNVRNLDEYDEIFVDSKQDAVKSETPPGGAWQDAKWMIRTGYYETSGSNHVEEKWEENPKLTKFMQKFVSVIVANTDALIEQFGTDKAVPEMSRVTGTLSIDGTAMYRARLRVKSDKTEVKIPVVNRGLGGEWTLPQAPPITRTLEWWSEPGFYVLKESGDRVWVTGADYNTYALIRKQSTEMHEFATGQSGNYDSKSIVGNTTANAGIDKNLIERIPETKAPAQQKDVVPAPSPPPAAPNPLVLPRSVTPKDVPPHKGGVEIGPQVFKKPDHDPGKGDDTLPGAAIHF